MLLTSCPSLSLHHDDNGTFLCHGKNDYGEEVAVAHMRVQDKPEVKIDFVTAVDEDSVYFNWTVTDWNSPVTDYFLSYRQAGDSAWVYFIAEKIAPEAREFVIRGLKKDKEYFIKLAAKNK